uniref:BolA-like protein n=1 Tax=Globodera rostochiensis TaxID=31243 RepID=A0A914GWG3_GLORO
MLKIGVIIAGQIRMLMSSNSPSVEGPVTIALRQKLAAFFKPEHLEVECESRLHNVPKGTEKHFRRQRMVNKLLADELREKIHALRIEAKMPPEWKGEKQVLAPPCGGGGKSLTN